MLFQKAGIIPESSFFPRTVGTVPMGLYLRTVGTVPVCLSTI